MTPNIESLRINAEYLCYPTWVRLADGGEDNPDPSTLGLPVDLAERLNEWSDDFDSIVPVDDPGSAAFPSAADEAAFYARGRALAGQVAAARPDLFVRFHSPLTGWEDLPRPESGERESIQRP
ncbi:MAG TPA: hypothetical protein PKC73_09055 [Dermatophilaceae bacterium]|jgi:hypothetical protein|nr:hypothetical protein [Actinomycetales bacterium]HMT34099.1 hypothetical protein [Dermatophilaceae bacterium]HMT89771.1 hypothetical protein [Dermatophilaceae bacterium]